MQEMSEIKKEVAAMSRLALTMWQTAFRAFMEHDMDLISEVLTAEQKLNGMEDTINARLIELNRQTVNKEEKNAALVYADVIGDLELIGDYCKDILERVQIKIEEKLLFSEDAVGEYGELYKKTEEALDEIVCALEKDSPNLVKDILRKQEHTDTLVDEYRKRHNQRLIDGNCTPMACNMFLNMLDFTAAVYYHTKKIAKNLRKLK